MNRVMLARAVHLDGVTYWSVAEKGSSEHDADVEAWRESRRAQASPASERVTGREVMQSQQTRRRRELRSFIITFNRKPSLLCTYNDRLDRMRVTTAAAGLFIR